MKDSDKLDAVGPSTIPHRMTDLQLQQRLAAKLPEKIQSGTDDEDLLVRFWWRPNSAVSQSLWSWEIRQTEWDYIVRMVEDQNSWKIKYYNALTKLVRNEWKQPALASEVDVRAATASASWQQRATAMKECGII